MIKQSSAYLIEHDDGAAKICAQNNLSKMHHQGRMSAMNIPALAVVEEVGNGFQKPHGRPRDLKC